MYVVQCMFVCMYAHMYLYVYLYAHTDTLAKNVSPLSNSAMRNTLASISRPMWRGQPANRNWQRRGLSAGCTFVLEACPVLSVRRPCSCLRDGFHQQYEIRFCMLGFVYCRPESGQERVALTELRRWPRIEPQCHLVRTPQPSPGACCMKRPGQDMQTLQTLDTLTCLDPLKFSSLYSVACRENFEPRAWNKSCKAGRGLAT